MAFWDWLNCCTSNAASREFLGKSKGPIVIIAGPPAGGKGTQSDKITAKYGLAHVSTGDILRQAVKDETELGKLAKPYMDKGELVPDELLIKLVQDRLQRPDIKASGCLLDGFPRTPPQGKAMVDSGLFADMFMLLDVPDDCLVERATGRRLDPVTGKIYHIKFNPPPPEIVDRLVHRSDDYEDKVRVRLQAYHAEIDGILPYFKDVVRKVEGVGSPDDVFARVAAALDALPALNSSELTVKSVSARATGRRSKLVVIAGPPAAGKGTVSAKIKAKFNYVHVSTGDILREQVKERSELGLKAKEYMDRGDLVPDDLLIGLVQARLQQADVLVDGCLLDGFPRTAAQAGAMAKTGLTPDVFLLLDVADDILVERGVGRRLDPVTGEIYHMKFRPPPPEIVDRLVQRSDDQEDKIRNRLKAYHAEIDDIVPFFKEVTAHISGSGTPEHVFEEVSKTLDAVR